MKSKDSKNIEMVKNIFNYIDSITIIDNKGIVMAQLRYNPRFSLEENIRDNKFALNKNYLEVIPTVTPENSTLLQVLKTGRVVFLDKQTVWDHKGRKLVTRNINFPIMSRGKIIGAIELSKDLTHIEKDNKETKYYSIPKLKSTQVHSAQYTLDDIISKDPSIKRIKEYIKTIANSSSSVLVYGETGTGKELICQSIHNKSYRKYKPFVAVNCAALPENLLEGILFGSVKGAYTGAVDQKGLFEQADLGTIYLDEINSMPISLQVKLLRVLQEKYILPLGGEKPKKIDVRVIASINKEPSEVIKNAEMREDLFYRLNVINIKIPPLRDRIDDILLLINFFIEKYNRTLNKNVAKVSDEVIELLLSYRWPGNVRELEHVIEAAMHIVEGELIETQHLPIYLIENNEDSEIYITPLVKTGSLNKAVEQLERKMITTALSKTQGNITNASKILEIPRSTLQYKIEKYNIEK